MRYRHFLALACALLAAPAFGAQVTVAWVPPASYVDGSILRLSELAGYRIYYGCTRSGEYSTIIDVDDATVTQLDIAGLPDDGECFFAATATTTTGIESALSMEVSQTFALPGAPVNLQVRWTAAPPGIVLLRDSFTDSDGVALIDHVPDVNIGGALWQTEPNIIGGGSVAVIAGNRLDFPEDATRAIIDVGETEVSVQADWTPASGEQNRGALIVRRAAPFNYYRLQLREPNADITLERIDAAGAGEALYFQGFEFNLGQTYRIRLSVDARDQFRIFIDGALIGGPVVDATYQGTMIGLSRHTATTGAFWDTLIVEH